MCIRDSSGVGFLFDNLSNKMTKEVLIGLVLAIILVGLLFVVINNYKVIKILMEYQNIHSQLLNSHLIMHHNT